MSAQVCSSLLKRGLVMSYHAKIKDLESYGQVMSKHVKMKDLESEGDRASLGPLDHLDQLLLGDPELLEDHQEGSDGS